jgi:putative oxidoreductase
MQRLFSTFPSSWPAAGLLLLRLAVGLPLILDALPSLTAFTVATWVRVPAALSAVLLLVGLWTPIASAAQVVLEAAFILLGTGPLDVHLTRAVIGVSLALLGPGAWSVDSLLYGRKRINL